jgi:hypothetical protein
MDPALGHEFNEPVRPYWMLGNRTVTQAEPGDLSSPGGVKVVTRGEGVWVFDDEGRRYFDSLSGMWLSNIGHGRREIAAPSGLRALLNCGFEHALIPVDELIPALYMDHPREDIRTLYPKRLKAYALEPALVRQLPKDEAGSDTEASAYVSSRPHAGRTPAGPPLDS